MDRSYEILLRGGSVMMLVMMLENSYKGNMPFYLREVSICYSEPDMCGNVSIMVQLRLKNYTMMCRWGQ